MFSNSKHALLVGHGAAKVADLKTPTNQRSACQGKKVRNCLPYPAGSSLQCTRKMPACLHSLPTLTIFFGGEVLLNAETQFKVLQIHEVLANPFGSTLHVLCNGDS